MHILGLDPAKKTGWCWTDGKRRESGVWTLKHDLASQHRQLWKCIFDTCQRLSVDMIATEAASFGSHNPAVQAMHNERLGVIRLAAIELTTHGDVLEVNPKTLKKFATGSGDANKDAMIKSLRLQFRYEVEDDNEADAVWVAEYGLMLAKRNKWKQ